MILKNAPLKDILSLGILHKVAEFNFSPEISDELKQTTIIDHVVFEFERRFIYQIFNLINLAPDDHITYFSLEDTLNHAVHNCYLWGNKKEKSAPITFKIYSENKSKGINVFTLENVGEGFDYDSTIDKFLQKEPYFSHRGNGTFAMYKDQNLFLSYDLSGRRTIISHIPLSHIIPNANYYILKNNSKSRV
ncbi:MAG: hypothetical protein ACP5N2_05830 [Candidatus Nanoarchaeia archaeon]